MFFFDPDVESADRYDLSKFMAWREDTYDFLDSLFLEQLRLIPHRGEFIIQNEERRPDLIAWKVYRDVRYWWLILHYNDIPDHEELLSGMVLKLPSISDVEDLYFRLRALERSAERSGAVNLPTLVVTAG